ncbi:corticotropin-releasing factor receptor 1-like isoform X2 [Liolophura sinensis]|uniref:corticotropin-releasing factor receptor 1-like isoform X2 n=1 Tax=Liolophura sinensis TaxID=3198878 RepID=UPI0031598107
MAISNITQSADANNTDHTLTYDQISELDGTANYHEWKCMFDYFKGTQIPDLHCPAVWDGYTCWPATKVNTTIYRPCPKVVELNTSEPLAHRTCDAHGYWEGNWTNYRPCLEEMYIPEGPNSDISVHTATILRDIYFVGGCISLVLLVLTLFIFCYFRSLQCSRISIHKNLVVSFIIRFVLDIVMYEPYISGRKENTYGDVEWLCKLLKAIAQWALLANFFWMFVEGLFLHNRIVVSVFSNVAPFKLFHFIGWGMPVLVTVAWAVCLVYFHDAQCWHNFSDQPYMFIIYGPVVVSLFVNVCFLISIIRVLIIKLRAHNTVETAQIRKAIRATVVLFPLLGITNLFFVIEPQGSTVLRDAYHISNAILHSSQGIFVSVLYCFMNGEVRSAIWKKWYRFNMIRLPNTRYRRRSSRTSSFFLSQTENTVRDTAL